MIIKTDVESVEILLGRKIELFEAYENVTDEMMKSPIETMLICVSERQELAHTIDAIDQQLATIYDNAYGDELRGAALNHIDWGNCPEELRGIYELGQKLFACFTRIASKEELTAHYVETKKEELLTLIKEQNNGVTAKTMKYYGSVRQSEENFKIFDNKY